MMTYKDIISRLMADQGWTQAFATEYAINRLYHGFGHEKAFQEALRGPFVGHQDQPGQDPRRQSGITAE
jgi:hypothetical protein